MNNLQTASTAAACLAYTGVIVAFMFSFWGIAITVFGLFFITVISALQNMSVLTIIPNIISCLLAGYYLFLCLLNNDRIKMKEMPDGWDVHHLFIVGFLLLAVLCVQFNFGFGICALPLSLMFLFVVMQYTLAVNFRTDG